MNSKKSYNFYLEQKRHAKYWRLTAIVRLLFHILFNLVIKIPGHDIKTSKSNELVSKLYTYSTFVILFSFLRLVYCLNFFNNYDQQIKEFGIASLDVYLNKKEFTRGFKLFAKKHIKIFTLGILCLPLLVLGSLLKIVEQGDKGDREQFSNIFNSLW